LSGSAVSPSVSVVMPTFNRRSSLPGVLEPLFRDPDVLEIVVVVDGCRDGSLELLESLAAHESRLRPVWVENCGMGEARMAGARVARGEIVLLLDDDVLLAPGGIREHSRRHAVAEHLVVVGSMPVSGGPQRDRTDYPRALYAKEYRRHAARWLARPDSVLSTLWAGHLSLPRADLLALEPPRPAEIARSYHSDIDFGLRCLRAGMRGVYEPSLRADHLYTRDPDAYVRDARNSGRSLLLLHQAHCAELGPLTEDGFLSPLPAPARALVRMARTRGWMVNLLELSIVVLGGVRLYRLQLFAAHLRKCVEQVREIDDVAQAVPAAAGSAS
jgi:glycosyltransferase involved in cell wall biosynthesis